MSKVTSLSDRIDRKVKSVNPLGMRVLVKLSKEDNQTDAGLFLPEGAKEDHAESVLAEVIEVASALDEDTEEEANISGIPFGATILIGKHVGVKVPWDDQLRVVETADVLAIIEEHDLS